MEFCAGGILSQENTVCEKYGSARWRAERGGEEATGMLGFGGIRNRVRCSRDEAYLLPDDSGGMYGDAALSEKAGLVTLSAADFDTSKPSVTQRHCIGFRRWVFFNP